MKYFFFPIYILTLLAEPCPAQDKNSSINPGKIWKDQSDETINAHGCGILYFDHTYFWFGEVKKGKTWLVPNSSWEDYRVNAGGISCYSSKDLLHWKYEGLALSPVSDDSSSDLHTSRVIERPKVIYNAQTRKFVMWMHIDKEDYGYAHAGLAVSEKAAGPYKYVGSMRPNGQESRDMTIFQDEDGRAYMIYSSEGNKTMHITQLSDDYLKPGPGFKRILVNANREAPALFKSGRKYYLITSLCTGWDPNMALYAEAAEPMGEWKSEGNPCTGPGADSTYHAQSSYVLPIAGKNNQFVFISDRWNKTNLEDSRYVWLPLTMREGKPVIEWKAAWKP
ncbi:MAG: glycoside hydrolase family 43 protein [Chitinophagales bacterium]